MLKHVKVTHILKIIEHLTKNYEKVQSQRNRTQMARQMGSR